MAAVKPQSKREEFRRYLEKAGVMDALTRVLVGLYEEPERPGNAIEYFLDRLSAGVPLKAEVETLQTEVTDLQRKIEDLQEENSNLKKRLGSFSGSQGINRGTVELDEDPTTTWSEGAPNEQEG